MTQPKIIDIDAGLSSIDEPVHTRKVRLFGREWTIVCDLNSFALSDMTTGDPAALVRLIDSITVEEERIDFRSALAGARNLTPERLVDIIAKLVEVAAERPTTPPSASSRGATTKPSPRRSAARS